MKLFYHINFPLEPSPPPLSFLTLSVSHNQTTFVILPSKTTLRFLHHIDALLLVFTYNKSLHPPYHHTTILCLQYGSPQSVWLVEQVPPPLCQESFFEQPQVLYPMAFRTTHLPPPYPSYFPILSPFPPQEIPKYTLYLLNNTTRNPKEKR